MRIIKIKIWDKKLKEMRKASPIGAWSQNLLGEDQKQKRYVPIEFTGCIDKKGREIYEFDILKWEIKKEGLGPEYYIVLWKNYGFKVFTNKYDNGGCWDELDNDFEVVGNIFTDRKLALDNHLTIVL